LYSSKNMHRSCSENSENDTSYLVMSQPPEYRQGHMEKEGEIVTNQRRNYMSDLHEHLRHDSHFEYCSENCNDCIDEDDDGENCRSNRRSLLDENRYISRVESQLSPDESELNNESSHAFGCEMVAGIPLYRRSIEVDLASNEAQFNLEIYRPGCRDEKTNNGKLPVDQEQRSGIAMLAAAEYVSLSRLPLMENATTCMECIAMNSRDSTNLEVNLDVGDHMASNTRKTDAHIFDDSIFFAVQKSSLTIPECLTLRGENCIDKLSAFGRMHLERNEQSPAASCSSSTGPLPSLKRVPSSEDILRKRVRLNTNNHGTAKATSVQSESQPAAQYYATMVVGAETKPCDTQASHAIGSSDLLEPYRGLSCSEGCLNTECCTQSTIHPPHISRKIEGFDCDYNIVDSSQSKNILLDNESRKDFMEISRSDFEADPSAVTETFTQENRVACQSFHLRQAPPRSVSPDMSATGNNFYGVPQTRSAASVDFLSTRQSLQRLAADVVVQTPTSEVKSARETPLNQAQLEQHFQPPSTNDSDKGATTQILQLVEGQRRNEHLNALRVILHGPLLNSYVENSAIASHTEDSCMTEDSTSALNLDYSSAQDTVIDEEHNESRTGLTASAEGGGASVGEIEELVLPEIVFSASLRNAAKNIHDAPWTANRDHVPPARPRRKRDAKQRSIPYQIPIVHDVASNES
jgi:hypothetical protein